LPGRSHHPCLRFAWRGRSGRVGARRAPRALDL